MIIKEEQVIVILTVTVYYIGTRVQQTFYQSIKRPHSFSND